MKTFRSACCAAFFTSTVLAFSAAPGDVDLAFDAGATVVGTIRAVAVQGDGRVVIGGIFNTVHGKISGPLARLNADGTTDYSFMNGLSGITNALAGGYGEVMAMALYPDGRLLVAGMFSSVHGSPHNGIVRLNPDGTADSSFAASLEGSVPRARTIALQADGKILVAGEFTSVNGIAKDGVARLNTDGTVDSSFQNSGTSGVECMALQQDGKVLLGGNGLKRLNANGTYDTTFIGPNGGPAYVYAITVQQDGKILISASNFDYADMGVARLNNDGTLDSSFQVCRAPGVYSIVQQPDKKVLIGGVFNSVNDAPRNVVARLNANGSVDAGFADGLRNFSGAEVYSLALQADGKVIAVGVLAAAVCSVRLNSNGSLDTAFSNGPTGPQAGSVYSVAAQPDGRVVVAGTFRQISDSPCDKVARLNPDGSVDPSFRTTALTNWPDVAWAGLPCLGLQSDGKIIVGGYNDSVLRLRSDGALDASFTNILAGPSQAYVNAVAVQPDGKILVGGAFAFVNGVAVEAVARLNADGSLDRTFTTRLEPAGTGVAGVRAIALRPDGTIYIGGYFTSVNGQSRNNIALLKPDGSPAPFNASTDGTVTGLLPLPNDQLLAWGTFSTVNGLKRWSFARLNPNGSLDASFAPVVDESDTWTANSALLQPDGKVLIARRVLSGYDYPFLLRVTSTGAVDESFFNRQAGPNGTVNALEHLPDGKLVLAGNFFSVNSTARNGIARLIGEPRLTIVLQPLSRTAEVGDACRFSVLASGEGHLGYQWFRGDLAIPGETNATLFFRAVDASAGPYKVVITNAWAALTSASAILSVIAPVERRPVPALQLDGQAGSNLRIDYADAMSGGPWQVLDTVALTNTSQFYFDLSALTPQRFYRTWQSTVGTVSSLRLDIVPAITLTGSVGSTLRLDYINQVGPVDAWVNLANVTLTRPTQLYFDTSMIGRPARLYRVTSVP